MTESPWRFLAPAPDAPIPPGRVPTFSVVVAAYNVAPYIGEALASAFAQTLPPHEVIVVDDGSTDDLDNALAPYRDRIVLLRRPNGGESAAKNDGVRAATGEFVALLDGDDVDLPDRLAAMGALAATRPDLDILTTDDRITLDGAEVRRFYGPYNPFAPEEQRTAILQRNFIPHPAVRRQVWLDVGGYDEGIRYGADWECWIRVILGGGRVGLVDAPLVEYRQRPGALTGDRLRIFAGRVQLLEKTARDPRLTEAERSTLAETLRATRLRWAREAVRVGAPDARALARSVVRDRRQPSTARLRAAVAAVAPGLAHRVASSRD